MRQVCFNFCNIFLLLMVFGKFADAIEERNKDWCKFFYSKYLLLMETDQKDDRLGDLLKVLKSRDCPQFQQECIKQTFNFSKYTSLLYLRFCNKTAFIDTCGNQWMINQTGHSILQRIVDRNSTTGDSIKRIPGVYFEEQKYSKDELLDPCFQSSLPFADNSAEQKYFELREIHMPFCGIVWCAIPSYALTTYKVSISWCMPSRCIVILYTLMVVAGLLSCAITLANTTVLIVFLSSKSNQINSQKIYKISIAVADLIVGVLVIPSMVETMRRTLLPRKVDGVHKLHTKITSEAYSDTFISLSGFFTSLSISVSIYSLMMASIDRLLVVYRPLSYEKFRAIFTAKIAVAVVWICALLYSILPFIVKEIYLLPLASMIVVMQGENSPILYAVLLGVPLVILWSTNIAMFILFKKNEQKTQLNDDESHLIKTLAIMVGVFTICVVPATIVIFCHLAMGDVWPGDPVTFDEKKFMNIKSSVSVGTIVILSNSLWNFFIYNGRSEEFQSNLKSLCKRLMRVLMFRKTLRPKLIIASKSQEIPLTYNPNSPSSEIPLTCITSKDSQIT
ncbi:uncharacterized protein LOC120346933 isoform X2 [Styela clava]